jgi:hypothetical protein
MNLLDLTVLVMDASRRIRQPGEKPWEAVKRLGYKTSQSAMGESPSFEEGITWVCTLAEYDKQGFRFWHWVAIPNEIIERAMILGFIPQLPEKTHT